MLKRVIEGNAIKQGSAIAYTTVAGSSEILDASQANNAIENSGIFVGDRMKLNRYYSGDAAGGSTTVTYSITDGQDDGYWRTSVSSAHDPGDNTWGNRYGYPVTGNAENIIGFSRPS